MWQPPTTMQTPAYVADIVKIRQNLEVLARVKENTRAKILLATKSFALPQVFHLMQEILDGTTASGLYEARLGFETFGKEVHVYSPAYGPDEIKALGQYADHVYFNSKQQLAHFLPQLKPGTHVGIRVNPMLSQVVNNPIYDPCQPYSRFGVLPDHLEALPWDAIEIFHVHALCENMDTASVNLIDHVSKQFAPYLAQVQAVNFGGGHFLTHPKYRLAPFMDAINRFQDKHQIPVILEPGGAVVLNTGYLVATVLDIIENRPLPGQKQPGHIAILDTSATCHMPDVLEVPYTPTIQGADIIEAGQEPLSGGHCYALGGKTCLTGDVIGLYRFPTPLSVGDRIVFEDMMQYSFVKNTTFNGTPLPDLGLLHEDGQYEVIRQFSYHDFSARVGAPSERPLTCSK